MTARKMVAMVVRRRATIHKASSLLHLLRAHPAPTAATRTDTAADTGKSSSYYTYYTFVSSDSLDAVAD